MRKIIRGRDKAPSPDGVGGLAASTDDRRSDTAIGRSKLTGFLVLASVNLLSLVAVVIALELTFGHWFADYYPPSGAIFDRTRRYEQRLYRPYSVVTYVRDKYGLRGASAPMDRIELVTVGGSTTDQRYLTEGKTWQDVIHALTGIRIANAGDDGMSSTGHIVAVTDWLHRLPNFHPQTYLHYIGVNDAVFAQATDPATKKRFRAVREDAKHQQTISRTIRGRSALYQSFWSLMAWLKGPPEIFQVGNASSATASPMIKAEVDSNPIRDYIEHVYKPNLLRLLELHRQRGEHVVLVSQPARPTLIRRENGIVWAHDAVLARYGVALGMINDATQSTCLEHASECHFIDLANRLTFKDEDYYDLVHATPSGARRIGTFLAKELMPIRRPGQPAPSEK
jgi:hypothetical protein